MRKVCEAYLVSSASSDERGVELTFPVSQYEMMDAFEQIHTKSPMNEERFAKEMKKIQSVVSRALQKANTLTALSDGGKMSREKLQLTLEETAYFFESATLYLRALCETQMPGAGGYGRRDGLEYQLPSGHIEIAGAGWIHMQIDTLLPHCRYMPATWLTDTVRQLLSAYMQHTNFRLHFRQMLLVIDEHSDVDGRHVFDQDNKGWKAVSNALKGWSSTMTTSTTYPST